MSRSIPADELILSFNSNQISGHTYEGVSQNPEKPKWISAQQA